VEFQPLRFRFWYAGKSDGSLDTNIAEFNEAFIRFKSKGSITLKLDYRDSSTTETDPSYLSAFYYRHRATTVQKRIYFRKAWDNISATPASGDTVLVTSTSEIALPSFRTTIKLPSLMSIRVVPWSPPTGTELLDHHLAAPSPT
jgi:hypothetical protein